MPENVPLDDAATITVIASICHEANRQLCRTQGDNSQPAWDEAPAWQRESATTGIEKIASGEITRPEQSHESWLEHKRADGWVFGAVKDANAKTHPCMVPYEELPFEQQVKDHLYFAIATTA